MCYTHMEWSQIKWTFIFWWQLDQERILDWKDVKKSTASFRWEFIVRATVAKSASYRVDGNDEGGKFKKLILAYIRCLRHDMTFSLRNAKTLIGDMHILSKYSVFYIFSFFLNSPTKSHFTNSAYLDICSFAKYELVNTLSCYDIAPGTF